MAIMNSCCCCGVRVGSVVVAIYTAITSAGSIIQSATSWASQDYVGPSPSVTLAAAWGASIGVNSLLLIAAACLFIGLMKDTKALLVPYMVVECLYILAYVALDIFLTVILANGNYTYFNFLNLDLGDFTDLDDRYVIRAAVIGLAVGIVIDLAIGIMCLLCVISQYQELRDGRGQRVQASNVIVIQQPGYTTGFAPPTYDARPTQQYYSKC